MKNWKTEPFEGTLLEIIEECARLLPKPAQLIRTQQWLIEQLQSAEDNPAILLPVRRFTGQDNRGAVFTIDGCQFVPTDNEPATALYEIIRLNGAGAVTGQSLKQLFENGTLPVSWVADSPKDLPAGWRFGPAAAELRSLGLKLAHIFDASQKSLDRETADGCLPRFFRTMNPINLFPFPGVKQVTFGGDLEGDVAENPLVQNVLRGFMAEYLNNPQAVADWLYFSDVELTPQQLQKSWKLEAHSIQLTITVKDRAAAPAPRSVAVAASAESEEHAAPRSNGKKDACNLHQLAATLSDWVSKNAGRDIRLDGQPNGTGGNRTAWIFFRVNHFTGPDSDWNGIYRFHGDTTIQSIRELIGAETWPTPASRPSNQDIAETIKANLTPAYTRAKNRSLILKGHTKPDGFFCFQV